MKLQKNTEKKKKPIPVKIIRNVLLFLIALLLLCNAWKYSDKTIVPVGREIKEVQNEYLDITKNNN